MKKLVKFSQEGHCPFCGAELQYHHHRGVSTDESNDYEWFLVTCPKCGVQFTEEYKLVYNDQILGGRDEVSVKDNQGKEVDVESIFGE